MDISKNQKWMYCRLDGNKLFKFVDEVRYDLYEQEFMLNYYWWTNHGKQLPQFPPMVVEDSYYASGE
ncbi:hypothetical protein CR513_54569, partial [Mucuna pruriens]